MSIQTKKLENNPPGPDDPDPEQPPEVPPPNDKLSNG